MTEWLNNDSLIFPQADALPIPIGFRKFTSGIIIQISSGELVHLKATHCEELFKGKCLTTQIPLKNSKSRAEFSSRLADVTSTFGGIVTTAAFKNPTENGAMGSSVTRWNVIDKANVFDTKMQNRQKAQRRIEKDASRGK